MIAHDDKKLVPSSDSEDEAPDFNYLLKLPPKSSDSHFLFASEKQKFEAEPESSTMYSKYFSIDTNSLNLAIQSIPFHIRHKVEGIEWSPEELKEMEEIAAANEELYRKNLEELSLSKLTSDLKLEKKPEVEVPKPAEDLIKPVSTSVDNQEASSSGTPSDKESIQQWLDDILDV